MGETPLMQAAGAPKPGAFQIVAKMLSAREVRWVKANGHNIALAHLDTRTRELTSLPLNVSLVPAYVIGFAKPSG